MQQKLKNECANIISFRLTDGAYSAASQHLSKFASSNSHMLVRFGGRTSKVFCEIGRIYVRKCAGVHNLLYVVFVIVACTLQVIS